MKKTKRILIQAAGGLVENEKAEVLFIFRRGKWDLPKGKVDPGESLEECAIREVEEETGVTQLRLIRFLIVTNHDYSERGKKIKKESHWYLMKANSQQPLIPQMEEDISELRWVAPADFKNIISNTYPTIIEVLRAAGYSV
jgi:8-oxo-dGTP pyrophosphatase MutT (NUDIX family)